MQENSKPRKESYDSPIGKFEVDIVPELHSANIGLGDRAFVTTESGNRYMIRHSKGRREALVIYDEKKEGFAAEAAHPFMTRKEEGGKGPVARVGRPLNLFAITEEQTGKGVEWRSTKVTRIEIRRALEAAIRKVSAEQGNASSENIFAGIAAAMGTLGHAHSSAEPEEINPLDPKYRKK